MKFLHLRAGAPRLSCPPPGHAPRSPLLWARGWFPPEESLHARNDTLHESPPLPQSPGRSGSERTAPRSQQLPLLQCCRAPRAFFRCPLLQRNPSLCSGDVRPPCCRDANCLRLLVRAPPTGPGRTLSRTELTTHVHPAVRAPPVLGHPAPVFHIPRVNVDIRLSLVPMGKAKSADPDPAFRVRVLRRRLSPLPGNLGTPTESAAPAPLPPAAAESSALDTASSAVAASLHPLSGSGANLHPGRPSWTMAAPRKAAAWKSTCTCSSTEPPAAPQRSIRIGGAVPSSASCAAMRTSSQYVPTTLSRPTGLPGSPCPPTSPPVPATG